MEQEFELIAKTFMGLEPVLAQELTQLGANNVQIGRRMVSFTGNKEMMYRANFQLHTAIRILKPIAHFKAKSAEDMYNEVKKIDWSKYIAKGKKDGLAEGEKLGIAKALLESAKRMIKKGIYSLEEIAENLDLPLNEVQALSAQMA